ncbi:phenylalanine--tRNA ligase [Ranunculus cassubicifolius]
MPKTSVPRDHLFKSLEKTYTQTEFEDLCNEYGIELDDVTTEKAIISKEKHLDAEDVEGDEEVIYKIEVPANRYDLLCHEGIVQALRVFKGLDDMPKYTVSDIPIESMVKMHVKAETSKIRPFVVCAVLRDITFDEASYKSFIDLQDKLHQNICRRRTLVAIGTHDLDTLQGPFTYEALPPTEINFVPLKQVKSFRADELMKFYESDMKLKKFLHIIEGSPVFPVIYDKNRTVLSLPPIINGAHSAISLKTKNVFIECTATDLTKAKIVLNTMVTMFSMYCNKKFEVEPVQVIDAAGKSCVSPDLSDYKLEAPLSEITGRTGIYPAPSAEEVIKLLKKMQLRAEQSKSDDIITVYAPPTRSDILHACDVSEDLAVAFGYNRIYDLILKQGSRPVTSVATQGRQQRLSQISDAVRSEVALVGFTEVLTWLLCSYNEIFPMLNRKDDGKTAVIVANPRGADFEVLRTTLMPGLLKTVEENNHHPKPIKIFEVGDVVLLDPTNDVGAVNRRHLAALYCGETSGFEEIQALVEWIMTQMNIPRVPVGDDTGYYIIESKDVEETEYLKGRKGSVILKGKPVGNFGIVHPEVLINFNILLPCSYMELDIQHFE